MQKRVKPSLVAATVALFLALWLPLYWYKPGLAMTLWWCLWIFLFVGVIYYKLSPRKK